MPPLSLSTPVMTPVYRATVAMLLMFACGFLQLFLYIYAPAIMPDMLFFYYLAIVPMGVVWSMLTDPSDWLIGAVIILSVYAFFIALVEAASSRRRAIAWRSLTFLIAYLAAMPLMDRFYGHML
jgi:lipoprotein signal peptidase